MERAQTSDRSEGEIHAASDLPRRRPRILIVDDEKDLTTVLGAALEGKGYIVESAGDGGTAMEMLRGGEFDLAILDLALPVVDGFGVLKFIKKSCPHVKVIMLTAHNDLKHAIESKRLGADDFLGKPYTLTELVSTINSALKN